MILKPADKVFIVHRRLFETDKARFFVGAVEEYEGGVARISGYTFVREALDGHFIRKEEPRTKIVSVTSGTLIVYQIAEDLVVDDARIEVRESRLVLTDGRRFEMNLSEHAYSN
jgi:hypothetical protein